MLKVVSNFNNFFYIKDKKGLCGENIHGFIVSLNYDSNQNFLFELN